MDTRAMTDSMVETVVLEKIQCTARLIIPGITFANMKLESFPDMITDGLVYQLKAEFASEKIARKEVSYPSDWWQAFKLRWLPFVLKKRWPVQFTKVTLEATALYPEISLPDHTHIIHVAKLNEDNGVF